MVKNPQRVHEVEACWAKRRLAEVGLHEIAWSSLGGDVDGRTHVHTHDMRAGPAGEMEPPTHAATRVEDTEARPGDWTRSLEVPVEDLGVDVMKLGEPAPFVAEGAEGREAGGTTRPPAAGAASG